MWKLAVKRCTHVCVRVCTESWVDCNDSTVTLCSAEDVHRAQAYILVYARLWPSADVTEPEQMQCDISDDDDDDDDDSHILYSLPPQQQTSHSSSTS